MNTTAKEKLPIDIDRIKEMLPHRFPFLMVDRVLDYTPGKNLLAIKNVTANEAHFQGHFPDFPVMPGVLILEALAQAGGLLINLTHASSVDSSKIYFLTGIDNARFRGIVRPGDQLILDVTATHIRANACKMQGVAKIGEQVVCSAEIMCMSKD